MMCQQIKRSGPRYGLWGLGMVALALLLVACRRGAIEPLPTDAPTPTTLALTLAPIVTATRAVPEPTPSRLCTPTATSAAVQYSIDTTVDTDIRTVKARMQTTFRNDTGQPLRQLVFNIEPNRKPGVFTLDSISSDALDSSTLTGPRLELTFKNPLEPDCQVNVQMAFTLRLNAIQSGYLGKGYFGFSTHQLNLGEWLPEVAVYQRGEWLTPKSWALGEYTVSRMGDYEVNVSVRSNDPNMDVVGPGEVQRTSTGWHFKAASLRSFTLSVSPAFSRLTATSDDGITIDLYYMAQLQPNHAADGTPISGPQHALETARSAVNRFTKLYGSLPYKRIVVAEGDFADGMEFSGMVFVSHDWFLRYEGKPDSWLTIITAHEVSHQWWYSMVGNDQGENPYLDEAFALYSELLYIEDKYPSLVSWWWQFRVKMYQPVGYPDARTYDFNNLRLYINAVYLRGALMLQDIRDRIGDAAFKKWLSDYYTVQANHIATPTALWRAMSGEDYVRTADIRAKYLRQPDPINAPPIPVSTAAAVATLPPTMPATLTAPATRGPRQSQNQSQSQTTTTTPCCG